MDDDCRIAGGVEDVPLELELLAGKLGVDQIDGMGDVDVAASACFDYRWGVAGFGTTKSSSQPNASLTTLEDKPLYI